MHFRHLDYPVDTSITALGPAALDDILERGDLDAWKPVAREIARDPFGATATMVLRICDAHPMYGTSALWRHWIARRRADARQPVPLTLAQLRGRAKMTQSQVALRLGISQADVSKLERRRDVRVSTLHEYARALGASLQVTMHWPDEPHAVALRLAEPLAVDGITSAR